MIGFTLVIVLMAIVFHFGFSEFLIVGALYLLIAIPSLNSIFRAGSTSYVLTNQRLVIFTVNLKSKERTIPLDQIQSVTTKSSGLQKFYGAGDILVYQKGFRKPIRLSGLKDCKRRAEQIRQAVRKARDQA
jgi:membrane protein YdbS with pleckstrin-like domain